MAATDAQAPTGERNEPNPLATTALTALLLSSAVFIIGVNSSGSRAGLVATLTVLLATAVFGRMAWRGQLPRSLNASTGLLLMGLMTALAALSVSWSLTPHASLLDAIRLVSYTSVLALAALLAQLYPARSRELVLGIGAAALVVSLYALTSRCLPGIFAADDAFARIRLPFAYWNAVGAVGALGLVAALWAGTRRREAAWLEVSSYGAGGLLLTTLMLSQSRGALVALMIGLALWLLLVPMRLRSVGWLAVVGALVLPVVAWAYNQPALSTDGAALDARQSVGWKLLLALVLMTTLLSAAGSALRRLRTRRPLGAGRRRQLGKLLLIALALSPLCLVVGVGVGSERGLATFSDKTSEFFSTGPLAPANSPDRLTQTQSLRGRYWSEAWTIWSDNKLHGTGADTFGTARLRHRDDPQRAGHAHGMVPQVAADLGTLGLLVLLGLTLVWLTAAFKLAGARRAAPWRWLDVDDVGRQAAVAIMLVAVVFGLHSAIDWLWFLPGIAFFGLLAGGWTLGHPDAHSAATRELGRRPSGELGSARARMLLASAIALVGVLIAWSLLEPTRAAQKTEKGWSLVESDPAQAEKLADAASKLDPTSAEARVLAATAQSNAGHKHTAERTLLALAAAQPENPLVWQRLANLRMRAFDDPEGAITATTPLLQLDPLVAQWTISALQNVIISREVEKLADRKRRKLERQLRQLEKLRAEGVLPSN